MDRSRIASRRLEHIAWWCLLAAVFLMPPVTSNLSALRFVFPALVNPLTADQAALPTLATLLLALDAGLMCWAFSVSLEGRSVRWHWAWGSMLLFLFLAGVSWTFSVDYSTSLFGSADRRVGFLTFFMYGAAGWLTLQMADSRGRVRALAAAACSAGVIQGVYGISQTLGVDLQVWGHVPWEAHRAFGTLGNPDTYGNYLTLVLPLSITLALTAPSGRSRVGWWVSAGLISTGIMLSFSRGAWLGAAVGLAVLTLAVRRHGVQLTRSDRQAIIGGVAFVALVAAATLTGITVFSVAERVMSVLKPAEGSFETRLFIWQAALRAVAQRPLVGWGPDAFVYAWYANQPAADVAIYGSAHIADDAHSYPLQIAATLGIPAALAYATGIFGALKSSAPLAFATDRPATLKFAGWFAAVSGYLVALLVGITSIPATSLLWIGVAVLMSPAARVVRVSRTVERAATVALGIALLAVTAPFGGVLYANHLSARAAQATSLEASIEFSQMAAHAAPWNHNYRIDIADLRLEQVEGLLPELEAADAVTAVRLRAKVHLTLTQAEREYAAILEEVPYDYWAALGLVEAMVADGDLGEPAAYQRAADTADQLSRRFPNDPEIALLGAYAELQTGDVTEAMRRYESVRSKYPDLPNVRRLGAVLGAPAE